MAGIAVGLLVVAVVAGFMVLSYALNGWVLMKLWGWFMVPLGLPVLTISWAIGIAMVVGFLTYHETPKKGEEVKLGDALLQSLLRPVLTLLIGWIVHSYMS